MGIPLSTARWLAPASFIYDFALQQYGLFSSPNMKDIHDANISFFSPQPFFIGAFFFPQQLFQLAWLYRLIKTDPKNAGDAEMFRRYAPIYALGNFCIGTWMFFWNSEQLGVANLFVVVNTLAQLWYVFTQLEPMDRRNWTSILTHVVAKTFAGIGVLDILHNTAAAYFKDQSPSLLVKIATGVGFAGLTAMSDWILGGCLVYDLVALSVGQAAYGQKGWSTLLGGYAVGGAAIVGLRNWAKPPYQTVETPEYQEAATDDVEDRV